MTGKPPPTNSITRLAFVAWLLTPSCLFFFTTLVVQIHWSRIGS